MIVPSRLMIDIRLDRSSKGSLADQVRDGIAAAINEGRLKPGARLPSWRDLASQLGIARGTVRVAYERLADELLVVASGSAGTRVVETPPLTASMERRSEPPPLAELYRDFNSGVELFQMGIPAQDSFPFKTWSRILTNTAKAIAMTPAHFPDPRGEFGLRQEIAAHIALARGIACTPSQIIVTTGYCSSLGLAIRVLALEGQKAWVENPGYPITRSALAFSRIEAVHVRVDAEGMNIAEATAKAPDAALAIVTPGQQAPFGSTMSLPRRHALLNWAKRSDAWIIEDDYLGELQLKGRAAPALAAADPDGRVIHISTFSKTISPTLRLGFLVVPPALAARFGEVATAIAPAPSPIVQTAIAEFVRDGHYLRHLRKMKRLYGVRRDLLLDHLAQSRLDGLAEAKVAGLTILLSLPGKISDIAIAEQAQRYRLAPIPLSTWYGTNQETRSGLLLSITNYGPRTADACVRLAEIISLQG